MSDSGVVTLSADARSYSLGVEQSEFLIGRDPAADLVIVDPRCSRRHARVVRVADGVMLEPLSDRARTLLNGRVVSERVALSHGDVIGVGDAEIRVARGQPQGGIPLPAGTSAIVIGRDGTVANVVLDHPSISRQHARLTRAGDRLTIEDLGSTNGVIVNDERISGSASLAVADRVALGPYTFVVETSSLRALSAVEGASLTAHALVVEITADGARRRLLDEVSLAIAPARFVAVVGPSGCGKSTLIRVLSGRAQLSGGSVMVGRLDLERNFETIKHGLAFVPQRETLLDDLVLRDALSYTARLRLSADSSGDDLAKAVAAGLSRVGMTEHAAKPIAKLSGGQRKRAALANELIARPAIIFADEVTSGLDDSTDREIMRLFQELARGGVTIVCVTHSVSNITDCCDELVVMAPGGRLAYHGPPDGALAHFGVESLGAIYDRLGSAQAPVAGSFKRAPVAPQSQRSRAAVRSDRRAPLAQLPALAHRTARVTLANARGLAFIAAQSIVVGVLFRIVFGARELAPAVQPVFAFLLGIASFWFGCSNASKEVVKERALFRLERDVNLRIPSYVLAKLFVQGALGVLQVVALFGTMAILGVDVPRTGALLAASLVTAMVGVSLGLAVSAFSRKEEQAASLVPIVLIPQLLLSTALVPQLSDQALALAKGLVSAYWMHRMLLDVLAGSGLLAEPMLIFAAHGVVFILLAGVMLFVDESRT